MGRIGISITRKTVASDIALLEEFGVDVITIKSSQNKYYIGNREFELPEVKLLVDAVESSHFITAKKSRQLVDKLAHLVSENQAKQLNRQVFIDNRVKPQNEEIFAHSKTLIDFYYDFHVKHEENCTGIGWFNSISHGNPVIHSTIGIIKVKEMQKAMELVFEQNPFGKAEILALEVYTYPMRLIKRFELR